MGAPIYLVSACASGEEFIAAFRRYADKNGLFIPIGEPLPAGGRSRFAITLRDGGVMIEGEAEVVSSGRVPSVLHGRVGMTLRFVEPDEPSKTTLGELERARLAMKPPPPSIPPRPADVPAEPRPVPPPVQGRIDAVNALAECVAIGDVSALGAPLPPLATAPTRSGRLTTPTSGTGRSAPGTSPPGGLGVAPRTTGPARPATSPPPIVLAREAERAEPPAITPRATPLDRRRAGRDTGGAPTVPEAALAPSAPIEPGPASDTMVAATPPLPPAARTTTRPSVPPPPPLPPPETAPFARGPLSATMTAVPVPSAGSSSAPTEIGGVLVAVDDPDESAKTQIHGGAPSAPTTGEATPTDPGERLPTDEPAEPGERLAEERRDTEERRMMIPPPVTMHGMPPILRPPAALHDVEIGEPTDISMPPEPPRTPSQELAAARAPSVELETITLSPDAALASEADADATGDADAAHGRPRRTVLGVAVGPDGAMVLPAPATRREPAASADADHRVVGDDAVDSNAPTVPPGAALLAAADQMMPSRVWQPEEAPPAADKPPATARPPGSGLPSGDWLIKLDPSAPDGWSEPFHNIPPQHVFDGPPPVPSAVAASRPTAPANAVPPGAPTAPMSPVAIAAGAEPESAPHVAPPPQPSETEPKVQIDPTLIEPAHGGSVAATGSSPELAPTMTAYLGPTQGFEAPAMQMMMAVPQQMPYAPPQHSGPPAYPMDPSYQEPSYGDANYQEPSYGDANYQEPSYGEGSYSDPSYQVIPMGMQQPGMFAGYADPRYAHGRTLPPAPRRRHLVIVLVTAVVAVLIGITVMLIFRMRHEPGAGGDAPRSEAAPQTSDPTAANRAAPSDPTAAPAAPAAEAAAAAAAPAPSAPPPTVATIACYADVASTPAGADIVIDQSNVIGTTPQRVTLPCGTPVELVIRKARLAPVTRTITATPEGAPAQVALGRQLLAIKVSSTPAGATVTLGGKSLGVTPTVVKVPAFEASMLTIAKDGYEPDTQRIAPKASGAAVHSVLKKLERKKPTR